MSRIIPLSLVRNPQKAERAPTLEELRSEVQEAMQSALGLVESEALEAQRQVRFRDVERKLSEHLFAIGRALVMLFLALREEHVVAAHRDRSRFEWFGKVYRQAPAIGRNLNTMFGVVRYFRTYMREVATTAETKRHGFHPLDLSLGLMKDRLSWNVLSLAVRLATKLTFGEARATMDLFVPNTPSTEVVEKAVLGMGRHTGAWLEHAPLPDDDGEVLVMQFDGKGAPTVTARELARRRRKRRKASKSGSPNSKRHRGRQQRGRHPPLPRRKKGDKSKNAKMATMVVMYTLRRVGTRRLEGPLNRWVYASFAPKRHAFDVARRMADKRGFGDDTGKLVQIVTDGDPDLMRLGREFFPKAEHTIDYFHVSEYLWIAGACLYVEGSSEQRDWVDQQKQRLFDDDAEAIVAELRERRDAIAKRGPGNKGRRERLAGTLRYLERRLDHIRYGSLRRRDLEIGSGAVEGAVKHVIAKRCDHGGMRWIKERAEAVLQLRCIEVNGQWDLFERFVHDRLIADGLFNRAPPRLQQDQPAPLPMAA